MTTGKNDIKMRFKATLEANRISRLGMDNAYTKLNEFKKQLEKEKNSGRKEWLKIVIQVLEEKMEQKEEVLANTQYGCPVDGGVGFGWGGGSGTDAG